MYHRKPVKALSHWDVIDLSDADHRAKTLGCPLNTLVTVRPCEEREMPVEQLCSEFARIRNNYDGYARRRRFQPAFVWTREIYTNNTGEHMHMKCHVPKKHLRHFRGRACSWMPYAREVDVRPAKLGETISRNGKRHSMLLYIAKQMTTQASWGFNLSRQKGGTILGRRWYASRNLLNARSNPSESHLKACPKPQ
jgi:hypothetical protein